MNARRFMTMSLKMTDNKTARERKFQRENERESKRNLTVKRRKRKKLWTQVQQWYKDIFAFLIDDSYILTIY